MKKLKLSFDDLQYEEVLTREQLKKVLGGTSGCGVKVNGVWHPSGVGASATQSFLGSAVNGYDPNNWSTGSGVVYTGGSYSGVVTNWCCDSCPWNQPASA